MKRNTFVNILLSFGLVVLVAGLGSLFVMLGMDWFKELVKPGQWISDFIIPIVWTIIYTTASIIIFLWIKNENMPKEIVILFSINGILNILWCLLFFTLHLKFIGLIAIIINAVVGFYLIAQIKKYKPQFFYALTIYPIWLSIASYLNLAIWILN